MCTPPRRLILWLLFTLASLVGCGVEGPPPEVAASAVRPEPATEPADGAAGPEVKAAPGAPVRYSISFPKPHTHYADVEVTAATGGAPTITFMMPVWTPGSYLVREFARNVEEVSAEGSDGVSRPVAKIAKNRWQVATRGAEAITLRYRLYCREMSVRTNFVEADFGMLNGAATFITPVEALKSPYEVRLEMPSAWKTSHTGLNAHPSGQPHLYVAQNFDELVDAPIIMGQPTVDAFRAAEIPHELITLGGEDFFNREKAVEDLKRIVETQAKFWGEVPYDRYLFMNMFTETGGGLEHHNSTLVMGSVWATLDPKRYRGWLSLMSHEFFHTWNVKALKPRALGPFDYEHENHTTDLWVAEGITSYYDDLLVRRAGLMSPRDYLKALSGQIKRVESQPGRLVQSLAQASFDAWIKYYRPDENSPNTTVSYYVKGSVVAFLLDGRIRAATQNNRSLDDVMRLMWKRHKGAKGYTSAEFQAMASQVAGVDLSDFFEGYVYDTRPLDYREALSTFGLRFKKARPRGKTAGPGWLGVEAKSRGGQYVVRKVLRDTPAWRDGLNVGDEIIALGDYRVDAATWPVRLKAFKPGSQTEMLIARRGRLLRLPITFAERPSETWTLEPDPKASAEARAVLGKWLNTRIVEKKRASSPPG